MVFKSPSKGMFTVPTSAMPSAGILGNAKLSLDAVYLWGRRTRIHIVHFPAGCSLPKFSWHSFHLPGSTQIPLGYSLRILSNTASRQPSPAIRLESQPQVCRPSNKSLRSCLRHPRLPRSPTCDILLQCK